MMLYWICVDKSSERVVRLGVDEFTGQRDRGIPVRQRETQSCHLCSEKFHRVVAAFGKFLGTGNDAYAQKIWHSLATRHQQMNILRSNRLILVRDDGCVDHTADQRLIAILIATDGRKLHLAV